MKVTEKILERVLDRIENDYEQTDEMISWINKNIPAIYLYINSPAFEFLNKAEKQLLEFLVLVCVESLKGTEFNFPSPDLLLIADIEEENWKIYLNQKSNIFRKKVDIFFEQEKEEELLAFIEDSLTIDDEETTEISPAGRDFIFVGAKSILDALLF